MGPYSIWVPPSIPSSISLSQRRQRSKKEDFDDDDMFDDDMREEEEDAWLVLTVVGVLPMLRYY